MTPSREKRWPKAHTTQPSDAGFVIVAFRSGPWRLPPALPGTRRKATLERLHTLATTLITESTVAEVTTFRGVLRPPGTRSIPGQQQSRVEFDAVLLAQTTNPESAECLVDSIALTRTLRENPGALAFAGRNVRRIADVDHERPGVFLFNFFTADSVEANLKAWQYTAGWFQNMTGLDNSTVIEPTAGSGQFALINHCRWDRYRDVLPSLVFAPSFRSFVLRHFADHRVAPHPVLYALDRQFGTAPPSIPRGQ